jgi:hypothetical protein
MDFDVKSLQLTSVDLKCRQKVYFNSTVLYEGNINRLDKLNFVTRWVIWGEKRKQVRIFRVMIPGHCLRMRVLVEVCYEFGVRLLAQRDRVTLRFGFIAKQLFTQIYFLDNISNNECLLDGMLWCLVWNRYRSLPYAMNSSSRHGDQIKSMIFSLRNGIFFSILLLFCPLNLLI